MSKRREIRHKFRELLTMRTQAEDRVFLNPARQRWQEELPAILVYTKNEQVEEFATAPRTLRRTLRLAVEAISMADEDLDDRLDELTEEIENAIGADESLGGIVMNTTLEDIEMALSADGNTQIGSVSMTFAIVYLTELVEAGEIVPLEGIDVATNLKPSEIVEAEDKFDLPQD